MFLHLISGPWPLLLTASGSGDYSLLNIFDNILLQFIDIFNLHANFNWFFIGLCVFRHLLQSLSDYYSRCGPPF